MTNMPTEKPNVSYATVCSSLGSPFGYFFTNCKDKKTGKVYEVSVDKRALVSRGVHNSPGRDIVLWCGNNNKCAYVAYGNRIIKTRIADTVQLSPATQKHLDNYRKKLKARVAMAKRLDTIEQTVAFIKTISDKSKDIKQAKKVLTDHLNTQVQKIHANLAKTL